MMLAPQGKAAKSLVVAVRPMRAADVPTVLSILHESPEATMWSEKSLLEWPSHGDIFVAEQKACVAGVLISRTAADELEILNLAVARAQRRQAVGSQLVKAALDRAFTLGAKRVYLELRTTNAGGFAFYMHMGFEERGRRPNYYRNPPEDAILLVLHRPETIR
jgi:ribosomal-protein-alanine N-acetyltransferase